MKKIAFLIIGTLLVLIVIAAVAEAGFRIYDLFDENRALKNCMGDINKKYCHGLKPNSRFRLVASKNNEYDVGVRINNYGFRGRDIEKEKKPGAIRIMVTGDSFTFGVGAREDETIPFLVEKYLAEEGKRTEVINAGFGHYSPVLHYLKVRDEYLEFKPDLVLYLFDFSDLADDWHREKNLVYDRRGRVIRCDPAFVDGKRDWWKTMRIHSRLCTYIHNKVVRLIEKIRILGFRNYVKAKFEGKMAKALIVHEKGREKGFEQIQHDGYLMIRGRGRRGEISAHFKRTEKYLNLIQRMLAGKEIPMILVIYPYGIHVGPDQWGEGRGYWGFERGKVYDDYYAFDLLQDYAKRRSFPCINLLPSFLKNKDKRLFFDIDGHFTPEANRIAAGYIVNNPEFKKVLSNLQTERVK